MLTDHTLPPLRGGKPESVVILLHGLGDSGAGLIDLGHSWREGLPDTEFVAPDAPEPCDMAPFGFQWFSLQDRSGGAMLAGVRKAAQALDAYIDHIITSRSVSSGRVALVGFSQGTMMALYVAPRRAAALAGVVGYSGALIGGETLRQQRKSAPPILLVHGQDDEVVPFSAMGHAIVGLQNANINVSHVVCPNLGHSIDAAGLYEGSAFLRKVLTQPLSSGLAL